MSSVADEVDRFAEAYRSSTELRRALSWKGREASRDGVLRTSAQPVAVSTVAEHDPAHGTAARARCHRDVATESAAWPTKTGVLRATVTTAKPLSESITRGSRPRAKAPRKKIMIERKEDPSLIAGVVTRIGDNTIDGSVRGRLNALGRELLASN